MRSDGGRGGLFRPTTSVAAAFGAPVAVGVLRNGLRASHQGDVLIQGHFCSLQPFDRDAFDPFRP